MGRPAPKIRRLPAIDSDFLRSMQSRLESWDPLAVIYLFGSRAKNTHGYYSDYDLLILSNEFREMSESERYRLVMEQVRIPHSEWTIEPHCYTREEWKERKGTLFYEEVESVAKDIKDLI